MPWTARFRFRVSKRLTSKETSLSFCIRGREAVVSGAEQKPLEDSEWLTVNVHNLEDRQLAEEFGQLLVLSVLTAGVRRDVGIDPGEDRATASFSKHVADAVAEAGGKLMPNVHGLLVYERNETELFLNLGAEIRLGLEPSIFLNEISEAAMELHAVELREHTALRLLSLAQIAREPLASAALSIGAVELLAAEKAWTPAQIKLLKRLEQEAQRSRELPYDEAQEVAASINRSFKSIRQSVKQKIRSLGLGDECWKSFDEVYSLRSGIFHGSITNRSAHQDLAVKARVICSQVVDAAFRDRKTK